MVVADGGGFYGTIGGGALEWEALTATTLLHSGANILVLRHPENLKRIKSVVDALITAA